MSDADLMRLYSDRLLALAADIPHDERLASPMGSATMRAPLCGSVVTADVDYDGQVRRFGQEVRACALGQAAAAVLGGFVIGRSRAEVSAAREAVAAMLAGGPAPEPPFEGFAALLPARDYPNRHASVLLALDATLRAIDAVGS